MIRTYFAVMSRTAINGKASWEKRVMGVFPTRNELVGFFCNKRNPSKAKKSDGNFAKLTDNSVHLIKKNIIN